MKKGDTLIIYKVDVSGLSRTEAQAVVNEFFQFFKDDDDENGIFRYIIPVKYHIEHPVEVFEIGATSNVIDINYFAELERRIYELENRNLWKRIWKWIKNTMMLLSEPVK